ncbi:MAG: restriction endonuclease subunit S [Dysgonamonadaceae bacterium]|jgi:type I restriction enzyme S subunit|nr:restriction endonuclease subunit S [Dysgonamonadaceae bacterium]
MKNKYLIDAVNYFISGDWGQEKPCEQTPNKVACIRGADIENVNAQKTDTIPERYVKNASLENKTLNVGDIVIEKSGGSPTQSTGRVAYISQKVKDDLKNVVCSNFCTAFKPKSDYYSKFIFYYFQNVYNSNVFFQFESQTTGIKNLLLDSALKNIPLTDFDLTTQYRIAAVLSCLDEKIALNNRINDNLEAMAKTIYEYWFVQNADEKWEKKTFGDYIQSTGGYAFKSSEWTDNGIPVIKIKDIQEDNTLSFDEISSVLYDTIIDNKFIANAGEVVIAMTGATIGKCAIVPYYDNTIFVNQRVGIFKSENPIQKLPFLINSLNQSYVRETIIKISNGAAQPNISNEQINSIELLIPQSNIIEKYNNIFEPIYKRILKNLSENLHLTTLRDYLLPLLMNGQVSVNYHLCMSVHTSAELDSLDFILCIWKF